MAGFAIAGVKNPSILGVALDWLWVKDWIAPPAVVTLKASEESSSYRSITNLLVILKSDITLLLLSSE